MSPVLQFGVIFPVRSVYASFVPCVLILFLGFFRRGGLSEGALVIGV